MIAPVLAFFGNLDFSEIVVVGVLAVLIFGKRLPSVASETFGQVKKFRRALDNMRRETGIDKELAKVESSIRGMTADVDVLAALEDPPEAHAHRRYPKKPPAIAPSAGAAATAVPSEEVKREAAPPAPGPGPAAADGSAAP